MYRRGRPFIWYLAEKNAPKGQGQQARISLPSFDTPRKSGQFRLEGKLLLEFLPRCCRALSRHLGRVLEMSQDSADKWDYEARIARRFGFAQQFELPIPMPETKEAAS